MDEIKDTAEETKEMFREYSCPIESTFDNNYELKIRIYGRLEDLLSVLYETPYEELLGSEIGEVYGDDGDAKDMKFEDLFDSHARAGCHGFSHNEEKTIHIWYNVDVVSKGTLTQMISHEIGHLTPPWHGEARDEEIKAERFSDVTMATHNVIENVVVKSITDGYSREDWEGVAASNGFKIVW